MRFVVNEPKREATDTPEYKFKLKLIGDREFVKVLTGFYCYMDIKVAMEDLVNTLDEMCSKYPQKTRTPNLYKNEGGFARWFNGNYDKFVKELQPEVKNMYSSYSWPMDLQGNQCLLVSYELTYTNEYGEEMPVTIQY